jgi:very-short-patch-repair endonuclease
MVVMSLPAAILRRAALSHGLVRRSDLVAAGLSASAIDRLVARGALDRLYPGVYRIGGAPRTWVQHLLATCWATAGVASHRAAARLWGVELATAAPLEVAVARARSPRPAGVVVHRSSDLEPGRTSRRDRVPVTDPLRMLADLGAVADAHQVAQALDSCLVSRLVTVEGAKAELARVSVRGRRGAGVLRDVLADWPLAGQRPESVLEVRFARLCRRAGLPRPTYQHEVVVGGRRRRIDFCYPSRLVAIEVDGLASRVDPLVFRDERTRQNELMLAGWSVVRFTWFDVVHRPQHVVSTLSAVLGARIPA